ncbi:FeoB-associated Cys-rich membrane protein [Butyrivibrio sp. VCB2006]|uniref:FeoB-associated Cys-rich membrane protein n=1 Tax=Butyrivibrio sp. VCB2006 TaxID=1280679 RepID=UPI0012DED10B|nr:FeoB-associated Cys-rich membrane protein [Butyrivibrio sp. VCB2006]
MANIIAALVIILLFGWACFYIYKEKKSGRKCIGCPSAGACQKASSACHCKK